MILCGQLWFSTLIGDINVTARGLLVLGLSIVSVAFGTLIVFVGNMTYQEMAIVLCLQRLFEAFC